MSWTITDLSSLCLSQPQYGANAKAADPEANESRPNYIRITDIDDSGRLIGSERKVAIIDDYLPYILHEGDLLLARTGNTVGKSYLYRKEDGESIFAGYLIRFQINPEILLPRYAFYFTLSPSYKDWVKSKKRVGGQPNINGREYASLPIPHPEEIREQHRIVEILDQADSLRRKRREADGLREKVLPALFHRAFGDPASKSSSRGGCLIGDIVTETQYGSSQKADGDTSDTPVLRMNNISFLGDLDTSELKFAKLSESDWAKYQLEEGDILFNRTNSKELVGKTGLWDGRFPAVCASYLIRVKVDKSRVLPEVLWAYMNTPFIKGILQNMARKAIGMANINAKELRSLPFFMPDRDLQFSFVDQLKVVTGLSQKQKESRQSLEMLFQSLLHRAFNGRLTAKWRETHSELKESLQELEHQAKN